MSAEVAQTDVEDQTTIDPVEVPREVISELEYRLKNEMARTLRVWGDIDGLPESLREEYIKNARALRDILEQMQSGGVFITVGEFARDD